jgi:hypothetical protein
VNRDTASQQTRASADPFGYERTGRTQITQFGVESGGYLGNPDLPDRAAVPVHLRVTMCHSDEVVRSVADSSAGRLTARRSWFQPARYRAAPATRAARAGGRRGRRSCRERRRGPARPRERQGDDRAGLTAGMDPAAYWGHGPDHRNDPRRDPRHMACHHGCGRDRGHAQDVCHHRTDRDGRLHRRVARGQAPWSRLALRSRRGHPMPAAARRWPAGLQTPGYRLGSLAGSRLPGGDHRAGDDHGGQGHAPGGDGDTARTRAASTA